MSAGRRQLGLDPGYGRLGYAMVEEKGAEWSLVDVGCFETPPSQAICRQHGEYRTQRPQADTGPQRAEFPFGNAKPGLNLFQGKRKEGQVITIEE